MNKVYTNPEIVLVQLEENDLITTSQFDNLGNADPTWFAEG